MSPDFCDFGVLMGYRSLRLESSLKVYGGAIDDHFMCSGLLVTHVITNYTNLVVTEFP